MPTIGAYQYTKQLMASVTHIVKGLALLQIQFCVTYYYGSPVEPQFTHFENFTQCEEIVPIRHFWQM